MITIDKREIKACCGKKQMVWKLSLPIQRDFLAFMQEAGFSFVKTYLDAGMMYVEDAGIIASGIFGQNELRIKCKNKMCEDSAKLLEKTLFINL